MSEIMFDVGPVPVGLELPEPVVSHPVLSGVRRDPRDDRYVLGGAAVVAKALREFPSGATRDDDTNKPDYEGFLSPLVLERYGAYMHAKRTTPAGVRESDNWQKGIPLNAYIKSAWRHFLTWWKYHRGSAKNEELLQEELCALLFNVMGYLHSHLLHRAGGAQRSGATVPVDVVPE